jgi:hypothetical protein
MLKTGATGIPTSEALVFWPHNNGWWEELNAIVLAVNYTPPLPYETSHSAGLQTTFHDAETLFKWSDSFKVIELSDLPLYIGWSYVSPEMIKLLKGV